MNRDDLHLRTREEASLRGILLMLVPISLLLMGRPAHGTAPILHEWFEVADHAAHFGGALVLLFGALTLRTISFVGRSAATLGVVAITACDAIGLWHEPTQAFVMLVAASALVARIWPPPRAQVERVPDAEARQITATMSAWLALLVWWLAVPQEWAHDPFMASMAASAQILAAWHAWSAAERPGPLSPGIWRWGLATWIGLAGGIALLVVQPLTALTLLAVPSAWRLARTRIPEDRLAGVTAFWGALLYNPARALVVTFGAAIVAGSLLLSLPTASATGQALPFIDALFMAVSATCITGLTVIDPATELSLFGQAVSVVLIQIGGLGIMTFSTAAVVLLGVRTSVRYETAMADVLGAEDLATVDDALWRVFVVTAATEAIAASVLTVLFLLDGDPLPMALWRGVFTTISAFCNAGMALQTDGMIPYAAHPLILLTVSTTILVGALGPAAIWYLPRWVRRQRTPLTIKLGLSTTAVMLVGGTVLLLAVEWNNTLAGMTIPNKVVNAWFQAVAPRTAGFASVDYTAVLPATWLLAVAMMFVGGNPGSTAGGVKTTTVAVLVASVVASLRGRTEATAFRRRMSHQSIYQATALTTTGFGVAGFMLFAILLTQDMPIHVAVFEVVSALGTVGLSVGGTMMLDDVGKIVIMACMFAGRLGPLTLFVFLTSRSIERPSGHPEESVVVG